MLDHRFLKRRSEETGAVDHAGYSAVAPNGDTLRGEVFAGVNLQGDACVFSASGIG